MPEPQNNFLIFNENNNPDTTMSDEDYASLPYRLNGVTVGRAPLAVHNKMYRQWSIMTKAVADMIEDKGYDALDSDLTDLTDNLKSSVKDLARDELSTEITTVDDINTWKESITATPTEINTLHGITASTAELNYSTGVTSNIQTQLTTLQTGKADIGHTHLTADITDITATSTEINTLDGITADVNELNILDGATINTIELNYSTGLTGNIQQQINAITGVMSSPFPTWNASTPYAVGDICIASNFKSYQYLECVVAGTTGATMPTYANVGQLVTDNEIKWLICDWRDSAPVGSIKHDLIKRDGWLKLNGATINVADYPRLVNFLVDNSLLNAYTATPDSTKFYYGDSNNTTLLLPDFEGLFIENSVNNTLSKVNAGLPNITGVIGHIHSSAINEGSGDWGLLKYMHYGNDVTQLTSPPTGKKGAYDIEFNASRGNSIYGNSNTVQPPAVKLIPVIKY